MAAYFKRYRFLIFIGLLIMLTGCGSEEKVSSEPVIRPVRTMIATPTSGEKTRSFSGTSRAGLESKLSFKVGGTVQKVTVKVGDKVKKGALIGQLDTQDYEIQVQAAAAQLYQAKAQARNAGANYDRVRQLYENNNASLTDLDSARSGSESAKAQVLVASKQVQLARFKLGYTKLTAPVSGTIAQVNVEANENVQAGYPIVVLTSGKRPEVEIAIPELFISQIQDGAQVDVKFDSIPDRIFKAVITEIGVSVSKGSSTYPVSVQLFQGDETIRSGMAAEVSTRLMRTAKQDLYFIIPLAAVGEDQKGKYVFVAKPAQEKKGFAKAVRTAVKVGAITAEGIEIIEGIDSGDDVVTAGVSKIYNGQMVKLQTKQ